MNTPGWPEYPEYNVEIVSPQLPCGAGWLGNCLLELGISLWRPWNRPTNRFWHRLAPYHYRYLDRIDQVSTWRQTLPALRAGREFKFHPNLVPKITHKNKRTLARQNKLILFVRDPRDALFSEWRRQNINDATFNLSFELFVNSPFRDRSYSYMQYLTQFLRGWKAELEGTPHIIVRFEDYRFKAHETLAKALEFFSLNFSDYQLDNALQASDFRVGQAVESERKAAGKLRVQLYHSGTPKEYKNTYSKEMLKIFSSDFDSILEWLGYEPI